MKTPPASPTYWICRDGTDVQGPYTLKQIQNMHEVTPFPAETPMKEEQAEHWGTLGQWITTAKPLTVPSGPHQTALEERPRSSIFIWMLVALASLIAIAYWLLAL